MEVHCLPESLALPVVHEARLLGDHYVLGHGGAQVGVPVHGKDVVEGTLADVG